MALYERLLGRNDAGDPVDGKIRLHGFNALLAEVARSRLTGAVAADRVAQVSRGGPLTPSERTEANALLATITGTATARLARAKEIDDVLLLAEMGVTGYATPSEAKTRLGV